MEYTLIIVIAALVVFVVGRRFIGSRKGTKYSVQSIFLRPVIYIVLSAILILGLELWQVGILAVGVVLGILLGMQLGKRSDIFEKEGKILYKRSNEVLAIWIIAFVIRITIDFYTNSYLLGAITNSSSTNPISIIDVAMTSGQSNPVVFIADMLLAFSAGLLFGEAFVLYQNFNMRYRDKK